MAFQYNFDKISFDIKTLTEDTETGYLKGDAYLTKVGNFKYRNVKDGTVRVEYRSPEEVFKKESLDSAKLVMLTNEHPKEMLNKDNTKFYSVGVVGENIRVAPDGIRVIGNIVVTDSKTIKDIKSKKKVDISMGYRQVPVWGKGTFDGEQYDLKQTQITYNHAAATERGRAGTDVGFVMDSEDEIFFNADHYDFNIYDSNNNNFNDGAETMAEQNNAVSYTYDSVVYNVPPQIAIAMDSLKKQNETIPNLEKDIKELKTNIDTLKAEKDSLIKELKDANTRVDGEDFQKAVNERTILVADAQMFFNKEELEKVSFDSMSDDEIRTTALKNYDKEFNFDSESEDYRKEAFRLAKKTIVKDSDDTNKDKKKLLGNKKNKNQENKDSNLKGSSLYRKNALSNYDSTAEKVLIH